MTSDYTTWKYTRTAYTFVVVCWVIYAVLTLFAPPASNLRFHLSEPELILLKLTVIVPIHLIWLMAIHGAIAFKNYAIMIRGGRESEGLDLIANGLLWTIGYLVITTLTGAIAPFLAKSQPTYDTFVVVRDHMAPIISLVAFTLIYRGSHRLRDIANFETWTRGTAWVMPAYALFAFLFVWQFASSPVANEHLTRSSASIVGHNILLFTLIVPLLTAWFIGVVATINITKYARLVKGVIYRQALRDLAKGLLGVIAFSIVLQWLSFSAQYFATLRLSTVLGIVYLLIILYGLGFVFVRSGARKLARIEAAT